MIGNKMKNTNVNSKTSHIGGERKQNEKHKHEVMKNTNLTDKRETMKMKRQKHHRQKGSNEKTWGIWQSFLNCRGCFQKKRYEKRSLY